MPVEFFGSSYPWSISMGKDVDKSAVKVTLIRQSDQKKWAFSEKKADGYFNVENSNYGQKGCIIFRPENLSYQPGDTFEVKITGLDQKVSYTVKFFSINSSAESDEKQKESKITAKNITKTFSTTTFSINAKTNGKGKMTYKVADEKIAAVSKKGVVTLKNYGETKIKIRVAASGNYKAAEKTITLTVKPVKAKTGSLKSTAKGSFALKWKQDKKATGYIIQYSTDKRFEKNVKSTTVSSNRTTSKKIGKLKAGKKYYVRICSYKKSGGKNIKGAYSDVKTVITKK
jgi:cysteine-rich secretory protein family./fibronectin type III domain